MLVVKVVVVVNERLRFVERYIYKRGQRLLQMLCHRFNCLVHHQIGVCLQILSLNVEKFVEVKFVLHHQVYLIWLIGLVFDFCVEFVERSVSSYSKQKAANMTLNLLGHLVAFGLSDASFSRCTNLFGILKPTKPSSHPLLN